MNSSVTELSQLKESLKLINNALNKASKSGVYTIDESHLIRLALTNIEKLIDACETSLKLKNNVDGSQ